MNHDKFLRKRFWFFSRVGSGSGFLFKVGSCWSQPEELNCWLRVRFENNWIRIRPMVKIIHPDPVLQKPGIWIDIWFLCFILTSLKKGNMALKFEIFLDPDQGLRTGTSPSEESPIKKDTHTHNSDTFGRKLNQGIRIPVESIRTRPLNKKFRL